MRGFWLWARNAAVVVGIAATLLALVIGGAFLWLQSDWKAEQEELRQLRAAGIVFEDYTEKIGPPALRRWVGGDHAYLFDRVFCVQFDFGIDYAGKASQRIKRDDDLKGFHAFKYLRILDLQAPETALTDDGIGYLRENTRLERVAVGGVRLTSKSLGILANMPRLQILEMALPISDYEPLRDNAHLRMLCMRDNGGHGLDDRAMEIFATLPYLEFLGVDSNRVTNTGIRALRGHHALKILQLSSQALTTACVPDLQRIPHLEDLYIKFWMKSGDELGNWGDGRAFLPLKQLKFLDCDADIWDLPRMKYEMPGTKINESGHLNKLYDDPRWRIRP